MEMYVKQLGCDTSYHTSFYTCSAAISAFDSYINAIVNRYKSNPAIFAWEIANEPRNGGTTAAKSDFTVAQLTQWISDRALH